MTQQPLRFCTRCGSPVQPGTSQCPRCGTPVTAGPAGVGPVGAGPPPHGQGPPPPHGFTGPQHGPPPGFIGSPQGLPPGFGPTPPHFQPPPGVPPTPPRKRKRWLIPVVALAVIVVGALVATLVMLRPWEPYNYFADHASDHPAMTRPPQKRWSLSAGQAQSVTHVVGASNDGSVIVFSSNSELFGVDAKTGVTTWTASHGGTGGLGCYITGPRHHGQYAVCANPRTNSVTYFDARTGQIGSAFPSQVRELNRTVIEHVGSTLMEVNTGDPSAGRADYEIVARHPRTLKEKWRAFGTAETVENFHDDGVTIVDSEVVLTTFQSNRKLVAYTIANGQSSDRWGAISSFEPFPNGAILTRDTNSDVTSTRLYGKPPIENGQKVAGAAAPPVFDRVPELHYVCTDTECRTIHAATVTGEVRWALPRLPESLGGYCGGNYIVGDERGYWVAHRADDGSVAWQRPGSSITDEQGIDCRKNQVLISNGATVIAYAADTGKEQWLLPISGGYGKQFRSGMVLSETTNSAGSTWTFSYYS